MIVGVGIVVEVNIVVEVGTVVGADIVVVVVVEVGIVVVESRRVDCFSNVVEMVVDIVVVEVVAEIVVVEERYYVEELRYYSVMKFLAELHSDDENESMDFQPLMSAKMSLKRSQEFHRVP